MMENKREIIDEESLESVVGGLFEWYPSQKRLKYTHDNGTITRYNILDYQKGYALSTQLHAQNVPEDEIIDRLIDAKYIED